MAALFSVCDYWPRQFAMCELVPASFVSVQSLYRDQGPYRCKVYIEGRVRIDSQVRIDREVRIRASL